MLTQTHDIDAVLARLDGGLAAGYTLRNFCRQQDSESGGTIMLVDDPANPQMLAVHRGSDFMFRAKDAAGYSALMADLLAHRVQQDDGWPDPALKASWEGEGRRPLIFIDSSPLEAYRAGVEAGFGLGRAEAPDYTGAHVLYWLDHAGLSEAIQHSCRLGRGLELFDNLRSGVGYDPEGHYVKLCLEAGPSFVCEDGGQPVCWSCTHLNQAMGMIYTPEEHRRRGYGRSLSAYQIQHMLRRDGIALCHVVETNVASLGMLSGLGANILPDHKVVWRVLTWPQ